MKNKLLSILLAMFMVMTLVPASVLADDISTISDVLATNPDFPTSANGAWTNNNELMYITDNGGLKLFFGGATFKVSNNVTKVEDNYKYIGTSTTITFVMQSNKLAKIIVEGNSAASRNGTYLPPVTTKTIAEILATNPDFPALPDVWINTNGSRAYYNSMQMSLFFDNNVTYFSVINSTQATKNGDYYEYIDADNVTYQFHLDGDNKLDSITISNHEITDFNGRYAMPVTVEFNTDVFGGTVPSQTIPKGTTVTKPADPVKEGYVFNYWSLVGGDEEFNFNTPIVDDTHLYANGRPFAIKDILSSDFPVTESSGWVDKDGNRAYINNNNNTLIIGSSEFPLNSVLTRDGDNYYIQPSIDKFVFVIESGNLNRIDKMPLGPTVSYYPYAYTNPLISKPVGYTGELEFVTNGKYVDQSTTPVTVEIDGDTVDSENYTVTDGSTHVKLEGSYVSMLAVGTHTIKVSMAGYVPISQDFIITPKSSPNPGYVVPNTGVK